MKKNTDTYRSLPRLDGLPHALYRAEQVREFDRIAIEEHGIAGVVLMGRAGRAAFDLAQDLWPEASHITVVCGVGNNGGDGYVIARLALEAGKTVKLLQVGDYARLQGDALTMAQLFSKQGGRIEPFQAISRQTHLIIDAVLGTGLGRPVEGNWAAALAAINKHPAPTLAIDIPSGLNANTGRILGIAVEAAATISFIGLKQGLVTGDGPACCGKLFFDGLAVPAVIFARQLLAARRLDWSKQRRQLTPRRRTAHKGEFGHVLVIGGAPGYSGAVRLAGEAAARAGAGLVSLATHPQHAAGIAQARPELMCHGVGSRRDLGPLLKRATVVVVGPGLGQGEWGRQLLAPVLESDLPLVIDADALNLLAQEPCRKEHWVLTPHPGEAARLLATSNGAVQGDRFLAAFQLQERYGGVIVLKGAGTLVQVEPGRPPAVCTDGNPGMASGGMGDLLSGLIGGFLAQGFSPGDAACNGVCLHGAAADLAAINGERGLLAGDVMLQLRPLLNPATVVT